MPTCLATWRSDRATRLLSSQRSSAASRICRRVRSLRSPRDSGGHPGNGVDRSAHGLHHHPSLTVALRVGWTFVHRDRLGTAADLGPVEVDRAHPRADARDVLGTAVDDHQVGALARAGSCPGRRPRRAARPPTRWWRATPRAGTGRRRPSARPPRGWCRGRRHRRRSPSRSSRRPRGRGVRRRRAPRSASVPSPPARAGSTTQTRRPRSPRAAPAASAPARRPSAASARSPRRRGRCRARWSGRRCAARP